MATSHSGHSSRLVPCVTFHMIIDTAPWLVPWFLLCPLSLLNTATTVILKYRSGITPHLKTLQQLPKTRNESQNTQKSPKPLRCLISLSSSIFSSAALPFVHSLQPYWPPYSFGVSGISYLRAFALAAPSAKNTLHMSAALLTEIFPTQTVSLLPSCTHPWPFPTA